MSENAKFEEQKSKIIKILTTMFDYLGLTAALRVEEKGGRIAVKISSEDAGRIIGRKGQTLESLQLLLNRIMFKDDEECPHIMLDIDGYAKGERGARTGEPGEEREYRDRGDEGGERRAPRERRERRPREDDHEEHLSTKDQLEQQALDAAKEVKRWGESVTLPEMNAHDRRIIHEAAALLVFHHADEAARRLGDAAFAAERRDLDPVLGGDFQNGLAGFRRNRPAVQNKFDAHRLEPFLTR